MRFLPTVQINNANIGDLHTGALKLQPGQWIKLAWCDRPSRWVGVTSAGSLWAVHWDGKHNGSKFSAMCKAIAR